MAEQKILLPYNFTANDEKSVDLVIQSFGSNDNTEVLLFHAYIPVPDIDISDKTVMRRMAENMNYLRQKIKEMEGEIVKARERLISAGFSEDKVRYLFKPQEKDAAQEIIEQANKGGFTTIVLNRDPRRIRKFFTPSVSKKVMKALKNLEIYMVS